MSEQYFPCVTILFSDIVNFTAICSRITPMQVVNMLNSMYSLFDELTERHNVYKVETIGDAYMICSGGGIFDGQDNINHAYKVCEMALDMIRVVFSLKDPSSGNNLCIRIGIHTGAVVGGIVGMKMPRYCLFGDTVNTASRIESSSEAQMVQISEMTKGMLDLSEWDIYERGTIPLKGKGFMKTYWLYGRNPKPKSKTCPVNDDQYVTYGEKSVVESFASLVRTGSDPGTDSRADGKGVHSHCLPANASEAKLQTMNNSFERQLQQLIKPKFISFSDDINIDRSTRMKNIEKSSSLLTRERARTPANTPNTTTTSTKCLNSQQNTSLEIDPNDNHGQHDHHGHFDHSSPKPCHRYLIFKSKSTKRKHKCSLS